jgi:hypothetical protein
MFITTEARDIQPGDLLYTHDNFYVRGTQYGSAANSYLVEAADGRRLTLNANETVALNRPVTLAQTITRTGRLAAGQRVAYEDMANPRREGVIGTVLTDRWGTQYHVIWDDGEDTTSDLRQHGWTLLP